MREHIRTWTHGQFRLELYDLNRYDNLGKWKLGYEFYHTEGPSGPVLVFQGEDFACSPLHAVDSDRAVAGLLSFLALCPGDTDSEYFASYTPKQLEWARLHGEKLSSIAADMEERCSLRRDCEEAVRRPGKFEGCSPWVPYYWEMHNDECPVDDDDGVLTFKVEPVDVEIFPDLEGVEVVRLYKTDNGFVVEL